MHAPSKDPSTHEGKTDSSEGKHKQFSSTIIVGNFDIPLSIVDKTRQKISKYIENLNRIQPT